MATQLTEKELSNQLLSGDGNKPVFYKEPNHLQIE